MNFTITLFLKFPLELRGKIWKYTLPGHRCVGIHKYGSSRYWGTEEEDKFYGWSSYSKPPTALSVCFESREIVKKRGHSSLCGGTGIHKYANARI
jgi:hypothetical protein